MADAPGSRKASVKLSSKIVGGQLSRETSNPSTALEVVAIRLFAPIISPRAPAAMEVASLTLKFSQTRIGEEWIVGRDSLLFALISHAAVHEKAGKTSTWLRDWLRLRKPAVLNHINTIAAQRTNEASGEALQWMDGREPRLSSTLSGSVGPLALRYAAATVGRKLADLRHLVFALLEFPGKAWPLANENLHSRAEAVMSEDDFRDLKRHLVDQIAGNPEPKERMEVWHAIAAGTFEPPETSTDDDERTGFQTDQPATADELDREGFADALVQLIVQVQQKNSAELAAAKRKPRNYEEAPPVGDTDCLDPNYAFMMHLDGPWGTGKSSVLNFVRTKLRRKNWLVVDFNAWKLQRLEPAWWTVITQIQKASLEQAQTLEERDRLWLISQFSRLRFVGLPLLLGGALLAVAIWLGLFEYTNDQSEAWKGLGAIITAVGGLYAFSRTLLFGQSKAVQSYEALQSDPYRPIMAHFELLFRSIKRPVIVLIDDLDRCAGENVVALIESIQTMLRGVPIVYLVAADRQWICTSFENKYKDFEGQAPDAGRPVGYLFLEKIFQVSTTLPTMSPALKERYWNRLVAGPQNAAAPASAEQPAAPPDSAAIKQAVDELLTHKSHAGLQGRIKSETNAHIKRELVRAAAEHLASPIVQQRTESRLGRYPQLMDANPRAMKRLLSAVTMTGARMMTEEREVSLEEIARWSALELRWPLLAARIARYPQLLGSAADRAGLPDDAALDALLSDASVKLVIGRATDPGALTRKTHKKLLG